MEGSHKMKENKTSYKAEDFERGDELCGTCDTGYYISNVNNYPNKVVLEFSCGYYSYWKPHKATIPIKDGRFYLENYDGTPLVDCGLDELDIFLNSVPVSRFWSAECRKLHKYESYKNQMAVQKRRQKGELIKAKVKVGDIVRTSKKTWSGRDLILVDSVYDTGIRGVYLENGVPTNELVGKCYEYIKEIVAKENVPMLVDGYDVNKCKNMVNGVCCETLYATKCEDNQTCYFKQLQDALKEIDKLKSERR